MARLRHRDISDSYSTKNSDYVDENGNALTPREYLPRVVAPIAKEQAIATLKEIAQSRFYPPAADARGLLRRIENGER